MPNGVARSQNFYEGSESVRHPALRPVQTFPYRRTSVLDTLQPISPNGLGTQDRQRALMGIRSSALGQSDSNFDKKIWLGQGNAALYNKTFE